MTIKELIQKAVEGQLDDEGKATLAAFDPDSLAANARRKAEEQAGTLKQQVEQLTQQLQTKEGEKLSETEQLSRRIADLSTKIEQVQAEKAAADKAVQAAARRDLLGKARAAHGITFVKGVDPDIAEAAWERTFQDIDDPLTAPEAKTRVEEFKKRNAALVLDTSGTGSGKRDTPAPVQVTGDIDARAAQMRKSRLV